MFRRRSRMGKQGSGKLEDESPPSPTLRPPTIESVAELIKDGKAPRIVVLTGAGVSTSAGIPDFRSPKTGLYANLARLNLPYAESVFDISYFRRNPNPFYVLARDLSPGKYKPTVAHAFIALLHKKGLLHMLFTQNIDCLDRAAGVPAERIVEAHGSFATQRCIECRTAFPDDLMASAIESGDVPYCVAPECDGLVKPDVVFFGESLPGRFWQKAPQVASASLVIVMGTSLTVHPFAGLPEYALEGVPRVLINRERVGDLGSRADDLCILSDCDEGVRSLADALAWREELETLWREVSGKETDEQVAEEPHHTRTKDEKLEDEIEALTRDVDQTLKLSNDLGEEDQAEVGGGPTIAGNSEQTDQERNDVAKGSETETTKTLEEPSNSTPEKTKTLQEPSNSAPEKAAEERISVGTEESTTETTTPPVGV